METFWPALAGLIVVARPWKAAIVYAEKTVAMSPQGRRRTGLVTVGIATIVGLVLMFFGWALVDLFHINSAAFLIAAGLIVLVFAIRMVIADETHQPGEFQAQEDDEAVRIAVYPLSIPMLITPPAVATLVVIGTAAAADGAQLLGAVVAFLIVMLVDMGVFLALARYEHYVPGPAWSVAGRVLGISSPRSGWPSSSTGSRR